MLKTTMYKIQLKCRVEEEQKSYNRNRALIFSNIKQCYLKNKFIFTTYFLFLLTDSWFMLDLCHFRSHLDMPTKIIIICFPES